VIAAISASAAEACGDGWQRLEIATKPDDASLLALAARLCKELG
jgi:uroporphyrinogen-III synthase